MLLMPTDDLVIGPICHMSECIAEFIAKDMMDKGGDIDELIREVTSLLVVVDAAISTSRLDGDDDWEQMRRCWAFIGPTLFNRLESSGRNGDTHSGKNVRHSRHRAGSGGTEVICGKPCSTIRRRYSTEIVQVLLVP